MPTEVGRRNTFVAAATLVAAAVACLAVLLGVSSPASAHVVPTSTVQLSIGQSAVTADVAIPLSDVEAASGIDLGDETQADVDDQTAAIKAYLLAHFRPTSDDGTAWTVSAGSLRVTATGNPATTGRYAELETTVTLTPPVGTSAGVEEQSFNLGYTAVVDKVATHVIIVTVAADATAASFDGAYELGTIRRNTVTDKVEPLHVDLGSGRGERAFLSMFTLGLQHIEEGTDHQLFLLTLLLPAPLLARNRRWSGPVTARRALRRIATITMAFTLGHSVTLALGALGVPVPQGLVEALIAVSILVAAVHALRPIFPGREAAVAAGFGLVHGLAFSEALRELHLSGVHLVLALLGFNLGIETMQLVIVALVLPPLILLARNDSYQRLRAVGAAATAVAAVGWLGARLGHPNPISSLADQIGTISVPVVLVLWVVAAVALRRPSAANRAQPA
ncbi:MAG: HupE/UreJ family protein [Marmoricola sp.]